MSGARDQILANIRRSLGAAENNKVRQQAVDARITAAKPGIEPARGQGSLEQRVAVFVEQAQAVSATIARVENISDTPAEIARYLRDHNLPPSLRIGADSRLGKLQWQGAGLEIARGPSTGTDLNALSYAVGGAAETGTLALVSGPDNPTTLNFLPDNHIVIVDAAAIAATYEGVLARLKDRFGKGNMPRAVNLVTGPSRSADIEQKLLLGAHGPRRLHIVIVNAADGTHAQ